MKDSSIPASSTSVVTASTQIGFRVLAICKVLFILTKPRLAFFSILTTMAAYGAVQKSGDLVFAFFVLLGTSLSAGGALSLNHWWEKDVDGLMTRTAGRPLPQNEISAPIALVWSLFLSTLGLLVLLLLVNIWATIFAAATILSYGLIYTPLKRRSRWATEVGAISGALPPLIGSAAAGDTFSGPGLTLFLILLFWQMPHFYAIGWMYRSDYQAAGFPLLPAVDLDGKRTASWSLFYASALFIVSLLPWYLGWLGAIYGMVAALGGIWFLWTAKQFLAAARNPGIQTEDLRPFARRLFLASVKYLPAILIAMVVDRLL
ncbi:MAG: heme o synthase [Verrucomicrobia bacterium]|nr:heme o synthase [Verrucomicrobiota bacterium]MDA1065447.1 heme o synthase [Verrucomicrobiota bacterium]